MTSVRGFAASLARRVRTAAKGSVLVRRAVRRYRLLFKRVRWKHLTAELPPVTDERRVLIASSIGGYLVGTSLESTVSVALRQRGIAAHVLLCDEALPACMECTYGRMGGADELVSHGPRRHMCPGCFEAGRKTFEEAGAVVHRYSDLLTPDDRAEAAHIAREVTLADVANYELDGIAVGEHANSGALRFFARADYEGEPLAAPVVARYLEAAVLTTRATQRLVEQLRPHTALLHHGIYVPQGSIAAVLRSAAVPLSTWNAAYRKKSFLFSHGDTYHRTMLTEPTDGWESMTWDDDLREWTTAYLKSRATGSQDWIWFHERATRSGTRIVGSVGLDPAKPCVGLLTNVMWDAQLLYQQNAFGDMLHWIRSTVEWFSARSDLQLLVRVHPAELVGNIPSRQLVVDELARAFPDLPDNVVVLGPESDVSTYDAMLECDSVIVYATKTGVELAAMGVPVVVAGEAWVRNKGITMDATSPEEYRAFLDRLPFGKRLETAAHDRALRYAFHFFFRRMIPLEFMEPTGSDPVFRPVVEHASDLAPGASPGLDLVLAGLLDGDPYVWPAEHLGGHY